MYKDKTNNKENWNTEESSFAQQTPFHKKKCTDAENIVHASYVLTVSFNNARIPKPFSDGEFVKECISELINILCPETNQNNKTLTALVSRVERCRIALIIIARDFEQSLINRCNKFATFSVAFDESNDITDTAKQYL